MKSQEILAFFYHSYKLTLLSNNAEGDCGEVMLCSHTKLHYSQTTFEDLNMFFRFAPLQNYTTLKRSKIQWLVCVGFAPIQNYTTLKHRHMCILYSSLLCTHTKLHYSQTCSRVDGVKAKLYTHTKLHYSQTSVK